MTRQRSLFDIVGPVMIGPSSSHTAGAVRLGLLARAIAGGCPASVRIGLHGSFASTGIGHGTDLALVAGLLGMSPEDERIPDAFRIAEEAGVDFEFAEVNLRDAHPNSAEFLMRDGDGVESRVIGASTGGGAVLITAIDSFEVELTGKLPAALVEHLDRPGEIAGVSGALAQAGVNIASMRVSREGRGARALMVLETDVEVGPEVLARIAAASGVIAVRGVAAV